MPLITRRLVVGAAPDRVFDLSRSIDLHVQSTGNTRERAVAGRTSGLIELGESVTWEATHFGIRQRLTSKITAFERPRFFVDEMQEGVFASLHHRHEFSEVEKGTAMVDHFDFKAPLGFLGTLAERLFLTRYLEHFLDHRNNRIKEVAESGEWRNYLPASA